MAPTQQRPRRGTKTTDAAPLSDHLQETGSSGNSEVAKPRRGRPPGKKRAAEAEEPQSKRVATERQRRRRRGSLGGEANMKLSVPEEYKKDGYTYRWIRNNPGRVRQLTERDDYDIVEEADISEDMRQTGVGLVPERHGGKLDEGGTYNLVLVRKPTDFYEADQAEKHAMIDETERGIKEGAVKGGLSGSTAYAPEGGISVRHGDAPT